MSDFLHRFYSDANGKTGLFYIAQAGFILKSTKGISIGIDLYLSDCVERFDGFKRLSPKVFNPSEICLDYVVATHWHLDHFDIDSMPWLMSSKKTSLLAADDCHEHVKTLGLDESRIIYIKEGDRINCSGIIVNAVFCDHGNSAPKAVGLVIEIDGYKIYIAGDTCLRIDKAHDIAKYGPFDVMIAPINGAFGNLNESDNVDLCAFHRPYLSIPCHFWTFAEQHGDPGLWKRMMNEKLPDQKYLLMAPGENVSLQDLLLN